MFQGKDDKKADLPSCEQGYAEIQEELEKVKAAAEEYLAGWKRAKADFVNFQKDTERQRAEWIRFSTSGIVLTILPIYESVEKFVEMDSQSDAGKDYLEGAKNIKKQFEDLFKNLGVEKIKTVGEKFDPNLHECVSLKKSEGRKAGDILEEAQAGYTLDGEVLRPAKVIVVE